MHKKHVLVMSFIGEDMKPAPQLREVQLTHSQLESAYQQCTKVFTCPYAVASSIVLC